MTFDQAVKEVQEELAHNRNGAFAVAVRLAAATGHAADKLMRAAVELEKAAPQPSGEGGHELVPVEFPSAEQMEAELLEKAELAGGLGPDTLVLVPLLIGLVVEERTRLLTMLGVELS